MKIKYTFLLIFTLGIILLLKQGLYAQTAKSRVQLEKEKELVQKKLLEFDKILKQTAESKRVSLGQLNVVSKQLETRVTYIRTLSSEISLINREIAETETRIKSLENDLKNLKEEYAKMVYTSSKLNQGLTMTSFIFSSSTFKQFYMRIKYLKQYTDARKKQVEQIEKVTAELAGQRVKLEDKKIEKQQVINKEEEQRKQLSVARTDQQKIVTNLERQEVDLRKKIAEARKQQENLNNLIKRAIEEEIRKAEAEAKKANSKATKSSGSSIPLTPEAAALSSSFAGNKGKLPWPVESGFVSKRFGTHPHPTLKGIVEDNDGVDIQTNPNSSVRTVFDGEVTKVATVPGYGGTILIKHGEYYTMYSKLKVINVKAGEKVKAKQVIGQVYTNKEGIAEVHFETWKGLQPLDPSTWLMRR
ncbi:peptidoglycan DD-metalloendopeptidase family protein [Belliella sp. DSM 111904]|uniref:Peptidoglycan DD-metalloendopeptidase family protein n=1 Tax=Belliella filtrata TaxID=2923435 RepID=A0ABS9UYP3_9BACT|nr:peptidoglycan DD-metalloendopeptidase family protein [Belliella filtrata]MCH7409234.1 peptidoglycan DD-metalloendopeptidase family protein [Belliella filtrata]